MATRYQYDAIAEWIAPQEIGRWIDSPRDSTAITIKLVGMCIPLIIALVCKSCRQFGCARFLASAVTHMQQGETVQLNTKIGSIKAQFVVLAGNMYSPGVATISAKFGANALCR